MREREKKKSLSNFTRLLINYDLNNYDELGLGLTPVPAATLKMFCFLFNLLLTGATYLSRTSANEYG